MAIRSTYLILCFSVALGRAAAPASVDFGSSPVLTPVSQTLNYSFTGLSAQPWFSLAWHRDFQATTPSCAVAATTTCTVTITFNPLRPGLRQDALTVKSQSGGILATTALKGVGTAPLLALYPGTITTLAGNAVSGYLNSSNPLTAQFWNPQSVALDGSGNVLYIADAVNGAIREINLTTGAVSTIAGTGNNGYSGDGGPAVSAQLNTPTGVAIDGAGNLYIADEGNNVIRRVDAISGVITTVAGGSTTASGADTFGDGGPATSAILYGPQGVAVDASGNIYIADTYHHLIRMVTAATGVITAIAGGGTLAGTDGYGDGSAATSVRLVNPGGVALDGAGNIYIADTGNNMIRRVDATSGVVTDIGGNGTWGYSGDNGLAKQANLAAPQTLVLDAANNIYIADYGNNAIRQIAASSNKIFTLAGRGSTGYYGNNGNPTIAYLTSPMGIAVDENGNLFIGDSGNNVIREVSYAPVSLSFPSEPVGATSSAQVVSPFNIGNQSLTIGTLSFGSSFQQTSVGISDCANGTALAAGAGCDIGVIFAPVQTGPMNGTLAITSTSLNSPAAYTGVSLSGTGAIGNGPSISFSATSLTFSAQTVATTSSAQTVTVKNTGGAAFSFFGIAVVGPQAGDFQPPTTTCGSSVAAGATCTVTLKFTPTSSGSRTATVQFNDSVLGSPQTIALSGTGNGGVALLSASTVSLTASVGLTSPLQSISLTNNSAYPLSVLSASLSGANASEFQLSSNCPTALAANASCTFSIAFAPAAAGPRTATLTIVDNSPTSPHTITLNGTATTVIPSAGLRFVPITPCRIADTRNATGPFGGPMLAAGIARSFTLPSSACGIPTTAQSYSLNFTIVPPTWVGFMSVWPTGQPQPTVSVLNSDGRVKANAAIVPAGLSGAITVYASQSTHVIIDINGYFVPATNLTALGFYPVTPCRVADTRMSTPIAGGSSRNFSPLASSCGIPSTAQAYSLNLTAVPKNPIGYLSTWPAGSSKPLVSTLNTNSTEVTANAAIVPAGVNGEITVYSSDVTDLVVDINGYFAPALNSGVLSLFNVTPCRVLDTRLLDGAFSGTVAINVAGSACAVSTTAQAYVLNATVVPSRGLGFLSLWQNGAAWPLSSILNADDGVIASNMGVIPTTNGSINSLASDSTNLILDISGYFAP